MIPLLCRTPTFVSKGTKKTALPQEDEEDVMDENGESVEEGSSSDSDDDEGDIPVFASRRKAKVLRKMKRRNRPLEE